MSPRTRAFFRAAAAAVGVALPSCVIVHDYRSAAPSALADAASDVVTSGRSWGEHASALAVRPCDSTSALVVNTTADLPGDASRPGELSFREALRSAAERPGPDTIVFDPSVFPERTPGVIEWLGPETIVVDELCIDARGRGVVLRSPGGDKGWEITRGSLVVGLELPSAGPIYVIDSQLAGCRVGTNGLVGYGSTKRGHMGHLLKGTNPDGGIRVLEIEVDTSIFLFGGAELGPGNVLFHTVADDEGPSIWPSNRDGGPGDPHVFDNFFGFDPLTDSVLSGAPMAMQISAGVVERNVFASPLALATGFQKYATTVFRGNFVGVRPDGGPFEIPESRGVILDTPVDGAAVGPENTFWVNGIAIELDWEGFTPTKAVHITRNRVLRAPTVIAHYPQELVAPPSITAVDATGIHGTCALSGMVEVFAGNGSNADTFVGEATCDATWTLSTDVTVLKGRSVTATLTAVPPDNNGAITSALSASFAVP